MNIIWECVILIERIFLIDIKSDMDLIKCIECV